MKNKSENIILRTFDSEKNVSEYFDNNKIKSKFNNNGLPSSKQDINFNIINTSNETNNNTNTTSTQGSNTSSFNLNTNENLLFGNDFMSFEKPHKLGKQRNYLYIRKYPLISIGENITYPLMLISIICLIYIIFHRLFYLNSVNLLKIAFQSSFIAYFISHVLLIIINPGIPTFKYHQITKFYLNENNSNKFSFSKCKKCNLVYKLKDNVAHCHKCNICYFQLDKHFFWSGHCVAKNNKLYFISFVISIFIFAICCLTMIFIQLLKLYFKGKKYN